MTNEHCIVIRNGYVLSMDPTIGDLDRADVVIVGDTIRAVGADLPTPPGAEVIDAHRAIVVPGLIDTHRHMFQAVLRGAGTHQTLQTYYRDTLGVLAPQLTPDDVRTGTLLSASTALDSGITTIQDVSNIQATPEHTDAAVQAHVDSGARAVFAYGKPLVEMTSTGAELPAAQVRRVRRTLLADDRARVTMAAVTEWGDDDAELANHRLTQDLCLPVARHISAEYPVERLLALGVVAPGTVFIHGTGLDRRSLLMIAESGSSLSVSPVVEQAMGFGAPILVDAPADLLLSLSVDVEVAVPGDFFTHMRSAFLVGRSQELDGRGAERQITARSVLAMATIDGARALGLADRIGSITPGKQADLVVLRTDGPATTPVVDPYSTVVMHMDRAEVETVLVAGTIVKRGGRVDVDTDALATAAAETLNRLHSLRPTAGST